VPILTQVTTLGGTPLRARGSSRRSVRSSESTAAPVTSWPCWPLWIGAWPLTTSQSFRTTCTWIARSKSLALLPCWRGSSTSTRRVGTDRVTSGACLVSVKPEGSSVLLIVTLSSFWHWQIIQIALCICMSRVGVHWLEPWIIKWFQITDN